MTSIERAKALVDQAYCLHDYFFELLEDMRPHSPLYQRLFKIHSKAHARWVRRESQWIALGGSYR